MLRRRKIIYDFLGGMVPSTSADNTPWRKAITGAAPPTGVVTSNGLELALTSASQAQEVRVNWADVLSLDIDDLIRATFQVSCPVAIGAGALAVFGLASAGNATFESITAFAAFKLSGSSSVLLSTDDNVNDNTDIATGTTLTTVRKEFTIDFASGVNSRVGALSLGGKGSVIFSGDIAGGASTRLAPNQLFDMSNYSSGLQPYFAVSKASGTDVGTLAIRRLILEMRD